MTKYTGLLVVVLHVLPILRWYRVKGDCLDPEVPKDGSRSSPNKHQFKTGEVIHYYCKASYTLVGSPKVRCLASGGWDTKPPTCLDPCGTCENGGKCVYQSAGKKYSCLCRQGYRGGKCGIPKCLPPANVVNGGFHVYAPDNRPEYDIESKIVFHCDDGYRIYGSNIDIKCVLSSDGSAKWSKPFPVCRARTCKNLMNGRMIPHGKYVPNKKEYSSGDVIVFSCDAGFELNSAPQLVCNRNGYWSAVFWPRCRYKRCPAPPPIAHGRVIQQSDDFPRGTTISFECLTGKGYYRFGPKQQTCSTNSNGNMVWQPPRPHCVTKSVYQHYCAIQGKIFTLEPIPRCINPSQYSNDAKKSVSRSASIDTLTIVTGTAGGLLGFLLVIIAFVIYQRRKLMRRMRRATSRRQRSPEDERMLIYCSNDFHFVLPSYDEAINSRSTQPPSFDDVVNSGEQNQGTNDGTSSSTQERDENTTLTQDSTEREYETIDNIQSCITTESTNSQRNGANVVGNDENTIGDVNVRTDRAPSEDSVTDETEPLV